MVDDRFDLMEVHRELKNELNFAVTMDPQAFMTLLHGFGYPNLKRKDVPSFLSCVLAFVNRRVPKSRNPAMKMLKDLLRKAAKAPNLELAFLHDEKDGELIADFSVHFMHCLYVFKRATHVLDRETNIEKIMQLVEIRDGDRLLDYRFADSVNEIGIQASDVVTGLIGRHFTYVQQHSLPELRAALARFSPQQLKCLGLLRQLIDRSDAFSDGLLHVLQPLDTGFKNDAFLHALSAPIYLG
jgi:hypothetical protein